MKNAKASVEDYCNLLNVLEEKISLKKYIELLESFEFFILREDEIIGYAICFISGHTAYIEEFFIIPKLRNSGKGMYFYKEIIEPYLKNKEVQTVELLAFQSAGFWEKLGFIYVIAMYNYKKEIS